MKKIALLYGSNGGTTQQIARKIAVALGQNVDLFDVANTKVSIVEKYDNIILGTSTWGIGDLQDDWEDFLPELVKTDLNDKTIALFGVGDSESYSDSFVDAMGTIYEGIKDKGCKIIGIVETTKYVFDESKAVVNDHFVGLPLDEDNESELTEERIESWLEIITPLFN